MYKFIYFVLLLCYNQDCVGRHHAGSWSRISKYVSFTQTSPKLPEHPHYRSTRVRPYNLPERIYSTVLRPFPRISTRTPRTDKRSGSIFTDPSFHQTSLTRQRFEAFTSSSLEDKLPASLISAVKSAMRARGGGRNGTN